MRVLTIHYLRKKTKPMKSILTLIVLFFSAALFSQDVPKKYETFFSQITDYDIEGAQKSLKKQIKKDPNDKWLQWLMGFSYSISDQGEKSIPYFEKAVALDSNFADAHRQLAQNLRYLDSTHYAKSEYHYTKAIQLKPTDHFNYVERGDLYLEMKQYDLAIADAEQAKKIDAEDCYFANRIIIESLNAQKKTADLKKFLAKNDPNDGNGPPDFRYQLLLGDIYQSFGEKTKACQAYKQAVSDLEFFLDFDNDPELTKMMEEIKPKAAGCK
jgi:tetratricopeptide (TPR) repeat protein